MIRPEVFTLISGILVAGSVNILTSLLSTDNIRNYFVWALVGSMSMLAAAFFCLTLVAIVSDLREQAIYLISSPFINAEGIAGGFLRIIRIRNYAKKFVEVTNKSIIVLSLFVFSLASILLGAYAHSSSKPTVVNETPVQISSSTLQIVSTPFTESVVSSPPANLKPTEVQESITATMTPTLSFFRCLRK